MSFPSPLLANVGYVQDDFVRPGNINGFLCGCSTPCNISSLTLVQHLQTPTHAAIQGPRQDAGTGLNREGRGVDECRGDIPATSCMSLQIQMRLQVHLSRCKNLLATSSIPGVHQVKTPKKQTTSVPSPWI